MRLWDQLKPTQKASLPRVAREMKPGDVIYAKQGPQIIDKGIVRAAYAFDSLLRLRSDGARSANSIPARAAVLQDGRSPLEEIRALTNLP
jgi:hypothetical protein